MGWTVWVSNPGRNIRVSPSSGLPDELWYPPSFLFNGCRCAFLEVKRPGREVEHSPLSSADVLNEWSYTAIPSPPYCSRTFSVYFFIRFARISYGRFIAIRYKFKRSTYIQEPLVIGGVEYRERFKRENG
jgi:hypothetical protein